MIAINISPEVASEKIVPLFIKNLNDNVANIRFSCIKILRELIGKIEN